MAETQSVKGRVHPSLPAFDIRLHEQLRANDSDWARINWIDVRSEGRLIQTIRPPRQPFFSRQHRPPLAYLRDVDCDGYKDLLVEGPGPGINKSYDLYRFDPITENFIEYKPFAQLSFDSVSCKERIVKSYKQGGEVGCAYESDEYQWVQGELKHLRQESQLYDGEGFVRKVRTWRDGKVKTRTRRILAGDDCHQP
jgi:hypothetical protein